MKGKSTLIRLLTLFEKPSSGDILVNGVSVSQYNPQVLRSNMSVLFQDFCKYYNLSVQDNIGLGGPGETHSISASRTAATLTGAHEHIRTLRAFYETILKKSYHSSRTIDSSSYDYYYGPGSLPKR